MVKAYTARNFLFLNYTDSEKEIMYMPNNPVSIGVGFAKKNSVLSFSYGYGFSFLRDKNLGKTESFDFQYHNYGRKLTFDVFIQKYKGFYSEDDDNQKLCPDLNIKQYGAFGQYVFNNKKYSYKAAFDQNEKQLKSAGSLLAGMGVYYTQIRSDSSFYHNEKHTLQNFQFGISAGYAYTWVIDKKWFLNGSATVGIQFGSETIRSFGKQRLEIYPTVFPRMSAGYNRETWALGFSYVNNITFPSFSDDTEVGTLAGNFQLTYIYRFKDIPFLSKILK
jgi:hypothetical protein